MAREIKEVAHTRTNMKLYGPNYDHIFNKKKDEENNECERCDGSGVEIVKDDQQECAHCDGTGLAKRGVMEKHDE